MLRQLDQSGFGAHCIQGVATSLGLLLLGRAQLSDRDLWTVTTHPTTLQQINPKAAEKFIHRLRLFRQPILSVVSKSIAFNTFAQSVVLYTTSYFGAATEDLQMLRAAATELLLGRSWIRQDLLAFVFRLCKIAPLLDPGVSILVSALGLFLRKGGKVHELYVESPPAVNRQTHEVRILWQAWARVVGEDVLTRAVSPSITRFTLLRWAVNEDDDEWLARRGQSRQKRCALCANFGRAYPLGGYQTAICETCIVTKQLTAFTTDSLVRLLEASHRELPMQEELPVSEDWEKCVACTKGDNTVGHWVRWCVVPISALRSLTGDDSILSLAEGSRKSVKHLAIASRVVHQFRLLLREAGAMRHQISAPLIPMNTWIHNLVQRVQTELPLDLRMQHVRTQLVSAHCSVDDSLLWCCDKPPLHISCALASARVCITREAVKANQPVAVVPLGSEPLQLIQQTIQFGTGISPNVSLSTFPPMSRSPLSSVSVVTIIAVLRHCSL